ITTSGTVTEFQVPTQHSKPEGITAGPDGNIWFVEHDRNKVARVGHRPDHHVGGDDNVPLWHRQRLTVAYYGRARRKVVVYDRRRCGSNRLHHAAALGNNSSDDYALRHTDKQSHL